MKIGYPARNLSVGCTPAHTFRVASYTPERFRLTMKANLDCLIQTLQFNVEHHLLFFRLGSDVIPFASHPVCDVAWWEECEDAFATIRSLIHDAGMRISMHPGQYTIVNTPDDKLFAATVAELVYHARLMALLDLNSTHKIQVHVGGVYGDKQASISRFAARWDRLPLEVKERLVIENDDRLFSVEDCLQIHGLIGIPIVFDNLHHVLLNRGEPLAEAFSSVAATWRHGHGVPMVDYSSQADGERPGKHAAGLDAQDFAGFLGDLNGTDCDIMLELKDKEAPALAAKAVAQGFFRS